jgi:hypothetical protein
MSKPDLTPVDKLRISKLVSEGLSFWEMASHFPRARVHDLRAAWRQATSMDRQNHWCPEPAELESLKGEIQQAWSPHQWGQRWVGRFASASGDDLQRAASQIAPN